jgi:hypothetical protein
MPALLTLKEAIILLPHKFSQQVCRYVIDNRELKVRFQVLTAGSMKMTAFWVLAPRSLV